ncbi:MULTISPECIES: DegT/DnrJ/EryC1/StrS family aminotransferase [Nocardia]|uniref:DegT/DnrJ/EryC1/StrS family aminotransferase n=1 Tax=Nocardia TaxID=1817 RepID=UPI000BF116D6|nr:MULTISPECIES: aminotransferase class I/II-fold pyridoxal phosphate-dependent enzyme [Nocardia]MBF6187043.1 aminotransferase class V-fold PLP-dependent enzyme [Nocardia farcinica]MBF6312690.1 aminotransferase class V-fold PLP-dependent enzyme [Nocardia farcinica]MBF6408455.1 aminotransferase class V-fold PLP-dependent enzyme [Nocardia farcinica]PEH78915.1 cell wall biogenesis protein [Nocardia sp. FDAARGOS_372]UEX23540.1 aminotransferase class I/II-fold pyridoxal phosphate-dependent enzyme [
MSVTPVPTTANRAAIGQDYVWPIVDHALESRVLQQLSSSLSDRDASGVIGEFERSFAAFVGTRYAVSFASGTAALHALTRCAGLQPGDVVIAPAYTFFATASPFAYEGIEVRFADADASGNLDPGSLPRLVDERTKAVIVTHMWGIPCQMAEIKAFCDEHGLLLFEDCSHAHFAAHEGRRVGTWGDIAVFSTNQKAITTGEGGVLVTDNAEYKDKALLFGHYNKRCLQEVSPDHEDYQFAFTGYGLKHRITTLGAAIGVDQLSKAAAIEARRRQVLQLIADVTATIPAVDLLTPQHPESAHGLYVIGFRYNAAASDTSRENLVADLQAAGGREFDIPGSTRSIADQPLFRGQTKSVPLRGVEKFAAEFFKLSFIGHDDHTVVEKYLDALSTVGARRA